MIKVEEHTAHCHKINNKPIKFQDSELLPYIVNNDIDKIKQLIEEGICINGGMRLILPEDTTVYIRPPLAEAISRGQTEIMKLLLEAGADPHVKFNIIGPIQGIIYEILLKDYEWYNVFK